ncbi:MAG: hypothetical protein P8123_09695, partial [bacterium]
MAGNILYLAGITLNACAAYWLALSLWGSPFAALVSGLAYGYCPFAFSGYGTVIFQMFFWIPLALLSFHNFLVRKRPRDCWMFLLFCLLQFFTEVGYGIVLLMSVALIFFLECLVKKSIRDLCNKRLWLLILGVLMIGALTMVSNWPLINMVAAKA